MSYQGKINIYTCNKGHKTVTIDRDDGVTPFIIACPKCDEPPVLGSGSDDGFAQSSFYRVPQNITPEYEWYTPVNLEGFSQEAREHILNGGLVKRKIQQL
jgi:hypothetical protein